MSVSAVFELASPYNAPDTRLLGYEQTADLMKLWHLSYPPYELRRYAHNIWTLTPEDRGTTVAAPTISSVAEATPGGAGTPTTQNYVLTAVDADGKESLPSAALGAANDLSLAGNYNRLEWAASTGAERYNVYKEVGSGTGSFGYIGGSSGLAFDDNNISPDTSDSPPGDRDPFTGVGSYPAVGTFHEQRTVTARTGLRPNGVFGSQSGDINNYNYSFPAKASDAFTFGLAAKGLNTVNGLLSMKVLLAFTDQGVWSLKGSDGYLSGNDIPILTLESPRAASRVRPLAIDNVGVYNTQKGNRFRAVGYQIQADGYTGTDLSVFSPHLFRDFTTSQTAWCEEELSTMFTVRSDGKMPAMAFDMEQQSLGWTLLYFANSGLLFDDDDEGPGAAVPIADDTIESACVVQENGQDRLYMVAKRARVGGDDDPQFRQYVERLALAPWTNEEWTDSAEAICLDCALTYTGAATATISNLDHLEGRTVMVVSDGALVGTLGGFVVTDGAITLPMPTVAGATTHVGLYYECWMRGLPYAGQDASGSIKGRPKQTGQLAIQVQNTRGIEVAPGRDRAPGLGDPTYAQDEALEFFEVKTREGEPMGSAPYPYTGELVTDLPPNDWAVADWVIRQPYPVPAVILGVAPDLVVTPG